MLPLGARTRALLLVGLLLGAAAVIAMGDVAGLSSGIDEDKDKAGNAKTTLLAGGCSCHNEAYTGKVTAVLEGVPSYYVEPKSKEVAKGPFTLNISMKGGPAAKAGGNQGGFNLQVTQGKLSVPDGATGVQVTEKGEATHTSEGAKGRNWTLQWTPPDKAGPDALFTLTVNSVNGDFANTDEDEWGRATVVSMGSQRLGAGAEELGEVELAHTLGIKFYAYWIGVISFIALFVVLAATFFLLRYGESSHWTDHADRPAKKGEVAPTGRPWGTFVVLGIVLLVFLVAAVQVIRVV